MKARESLLGRRIREKAVQEKHEWAKTLKRGDKIYCAAAGTFLGGGIQRGDAFRAQHYQPRAKRLWFYRGETEPPRNSSKWFYMDVAALNNYNMQSEPPDSPLSSLDRKMANAVGGILSEELAH